MSMRQVPYPLIGSSNPEIVPKIDSQRTVNLYEINDPEGKEPSVLQDMPGLLQKASMGADDTVGCRGMLQHGDYLYAVYGDILYRVDNGFLVSSLGSPLTTSTGPVRFSVNENEILLVDAVKGYLWNFTTSTATFPIVDPDFPAQPIDVTNVDGYFIVTEGESNDWYWSALNDGLNWNSTDTEKIISKPDQCIAIATVNRRMFIFGKNITEQWYDDPVGTTPFQRNNNMLFEYGCASRASVVENYGILVFLASTKNGVGSVRVTDGGQPQIISTPALDRIIKGYEIDHVVSDASGMIYKENGQIFYEISFTTANHTWVYSFSTKKWFERESLPDKRFKGECYANFLGSHFVGDYSTNKLYEMSSQYADQNGDSYRRMRIGKPFSLPSLKSFRVNRFELDLVNGVGTATGITQDPLVRLSISRDGGLTYGNALEASLGKMSQSLYTSEWYRLGSQTDFVPKIEFWHSVPTTLLGAAINYDEFVR